MRRRTLVWTMAFLAFGSPMQAASDCAGLQADAQQLALSYLQTRITLAATAEEIKAADRDWALLLAPRGFFADPQADTMAAADMLSLLDDRVPDEVLELQDIAAARDAVDRLRWATRRAEQLLNTMEVQQTALVAAYRVIDRECTDVTPADDPDNPYAGLPVTNGVVMIANAGIPGHNVEQPTLTLWQCVARCREQTWCVTVDFERADSTCYLQDVSGLSADIRYDYEGNPYDHYALVDRLER